VFIQKYLYKSVYTKDVYTKVFIQKCLYKSVYIFKLILSVCKAFKAMSKFFKSNNSLIFDINLL
jgi:hypothetical protein